MSIDPAKPAALEQTERQAAELQAMRRMLAASRGTFSLSIAICNSPALRDYLIEQLRQDEDGIEVVSLPEGTSDVVEEVAQAGVDVECSALFLINLEKSIPSAEQDYPVLGALNASRELWAQAHPCPVVFWLPDYAATLLARHARDLWAWRSHQFEFVSELVSPVAAIRSDGGVDFHIAANLSAEQKQFRIAELEQRVAEAGDPPPRELATHVSVWLHELGFLFLTTGQLPDGERMCRKALAIDEESGNRGGIAIGYYELGMVAQRRGDLAGAEDWYRKALAIYEELGSRPGIARSHHQLGMVAQSRGDLAAAEEGYRKAMTILEELGDHRSMGTSYNQFGTVAHDRGDLAAAEDWCRKALAIKEALGNRPGLASSYHQLGMVAHDRGDLAAAEDWYRKAMAISEELGNPPGMAMSYGQLGRLAQLCGDLGAAEDWYRKALRIFGELQDRPHTALTYAQIGLLCEARGQAEDALEWCIRAVALFLPEFPSRQTGTAPRQLSQLTERLGQDVLAATWQRVTGQAVPDNVTQTIPLILEALKKQGDE